MLRQRIITAVIMLAVLVAALWHGHRIAVHVAPHAPGPGVDTPEDLARVQALFAQAA